MSLHILDLTGTFVFAISGATAGVRHHLDLFGVLVLSFAAAPYSVSGYAPPPSTTACICQPPA